MDLKGKIKNCIFVSSKRYSLKKIEGNSQIKVDLLINNNCERP